VRLDRYDSYLTNFHAHVAEVRTDANGTWVRLDRSAFYPHAGGQPHDVGELEAAGARLRVIDVRAPADDEVWHLLDLDGATANATGLRPGTPVVGAIDWPRRWRHMQRHSAQHLLSAALIRVNAAFGTLAVSMRGPDCTIEIAGEFGEAHLAAVEAEANLVARRNLPIDAFEVDESRLGDYDLRRPSKVGGIVRLVAIGQYDIVACGGTHLRSTAEALPIKLLGYERVRGGNTRITFRAGVEALDDYGAKHAWVTHLGRLFSVPAGELRGRAERLLADLAAAKREAADWRERVATGLAEGLASTGSNPLVAVLEGADADLLTELMDACQKQAGCVALLGAANGGHAQLAFIAGPGAGVDVRPLLADALTALGGRGGGRADRAQGAAEADPGRVREVLEAVANGLRGGWTHVR